MVRVTQQRLSTHSPPRRSASRLSALIPLRFADISVFYFVFSEKRFCSSGCSELICNTAKIQTPQTLNLTSAHVFAAIVDSHSGDVMLLRRHGTLSSSLSAYPHPHLGPGFICFNALVPHVRVRGCVT